MLKATDGARSKPGPAARHVDQFQEALQIVARLITQGRLHEQILQSAGVRLDRAGAALLHKLDAEGDSLRITELAELLGVDAPTVTRKVQQLERQGLVVRQSDPADGRATRIRLTPVGRRTLERVIRARQTWLDGLLKDWGDEDLAAMATLFGRFAAEVEESFVGARD